ncbi:MAG: uroporphyrinogen-III synthase [Burkholderiaceae bacterium]
MVTRPGDEAERWAAGLRAHGWPASALPLIEIGPPGSSVAREALVQARLRWADWDALMFVSSAAVTHFFDPSGAVAFDRGTTRFWAPGPGTAATLKLALAQRGVSSERIDSPPHQAQQFDSESLWPVVSHQLAPGKRVLVVRGGSSDGPKTASGLAGRGRDWLIDQCRRLGASVDACVAYERHAPRWGVQELEQASAAVAAGSAWLFSSSEAVKNLLQGLPGVKWAQASALATHDRIAQVALGAGFGEVRVSRPTQPDVLRALESHWSRP